MKLLVIAIDGPSGAGKGTLARTVAERGYELMQVISPNRSPTPIVAFGLL